MLSAGEPKPYHGSPYQYGGYQGPQQYGKLNGGYQGPQQAVLYSINNDHYLLRLLQDMERYEGSEVNYLVNKQMKEANSGYYNNAEYATSTPAPGSTSTTPSSSETSEAETTLEGESSSSTTTPASTTASTPKYTTPANECEIVIGKNGYVSSKVAYYNYPAAPYYENPITRYSGPLYAVRPPPPPYYHPINNY